MAFDGPDNPVSQHDHSGTLTKHGQSAGSCISQRLHHLEGACQLVHGAGLTTRNDQSVDLAELLARADVVSLHCPLTPETTGLISAARLARMKPDAILINTARGALVDVAALAATLRSRRLGGAAIDVLPEEPPTGGSPLFAPDLANLIVTPHMAWAARESRQRCLDELAANIEDWRRGGMRGRVV